METIRYLQKLFHRYNQRYWQGRLPTYEIVASDEFPHGQCFPAKRQIHINVGRHWSRKHLRDTLVHEMAHAATNGGHGAKWLAEMNRLSEAGAPVAPHDLNPERWLTPKHIVAEFADAAWEPEMTWRQARLSIGREYGWLKNDGSPDGKGAIRWLQKAEKEFKRSRRQYLEMKRAEEALKNTLS